MSRCGGAICTVRRTVSHVSYECVVYLWRVVRCVFRFLWRYIVSCAVTPMVLVVGFIWRSTATPVINNRIHYFARTSIKDTETYRLGYPGKADNPSLVDNYRFYANEIPSRPDGDLIDDIHERWWGQYNKLESHHGYIQWLFPIREHGLNSAAQELQLHEAKRICSDPEIHARVLRSYELMLDFYGMKLKDKETGEIERSDNWKERFRHLNHSSHNYLRITRILKCLGEMEYEYLKAPFLRFVLHEAIVEGTLDRTLDSCMNYWLEVLKDDQERASIRTMANELKSEATETSV